jgi:hypothetical protein
MPKIAAIGQSKLKQGKLKYFMCSLQALHYDLCGS